MRQLFLMKTKYTVVWNINNIQVKHLKDKTTQYSLEIIETMFQFSSSRNTILLFNPNFEEEYFARKCPCMSDDCFGYNFTTQEHPSRPFATVPFAQSGII